MSCAGPADGNLSRRRALCVCVWGGALTELLTNEIRLPGITRNKYAYLDYGKGDAQVSYLGAYFMARSIGAKVFRNNVVCPNETNPIFGLEVSSSPSVGGSIMVGFDFGVPCGPVVNLPPVKETGARAQAVMLSRSAHPPRRCGRRCR